MTRVSRRFQQSLRLWAGAGTEFNLADCWEHLGQIDQARSLFLDVAEKTHALGQTKREQLARDRADALLSPVTAPEETNSVAPMTIFAKPQSQRSDTPDATRSNAPSAVLREESDSLAEATAQLRGLEQGAALLSRLAPGEPRLERLLGELSAVRQGLAGAWALAGALAMQLSRRVPTVPTASDMEMGAPTEPSTRAAANSLASTSTASGR